MEDQREVLEQRLLANRRIEDCGYATPCWIWTRGRSLGYGKLWIKVGGRRRQVPAHRLAAHLWKKMPLFSPMEACHHCDNPPCFNPEHLFIGTHYENMQDAITKGRQYQPGAPGERNGASKLTEADVLQIRRLLASGMVGREIARQYNVTPAQISHIKLRKAWRHV